MILLTVDVKIYLDVSCECEDISRREL
jgi:hypothetical protein